MSTRGELFDPIFGSERVRDEVSDRAWVTTMLEVEAALARAAASVGMVDAAHCAAIERSVSELAAPGGIDIVELGRSAVNGGNPVIPLVGLLRERAVTHGVPGDQVHRGATSQDILDTALVLLIRRAGAVVLEDLTAAADSAAELARLHRTTPMVARTLGQQALPTTFGLLAATWFVALDTATRRVRSAISSLPVSLGGAAGTLAGLHPEGLRIADALADDLGLARAGLPWHTDRTVVADVATAFGLAAGAMSKPATDIIAMASTELAEVSENDPGGSSAMPHKQNPTSAITARASARRVPALVATVLANTDHEFQRASGAWHAEWETVSTLLRCTGGAACRLSGSLGGLVVHPDAMARNLEITGGLILAERVTAAMSTRTDRAREIVTRAARSGHRLDEDPEVTEHLSAVELEELTDPANYLGHAADLVDRALAARSGGPS
ncbi:3-carboxy-cis,cis-muconate cycloisomerase [Gordonia sp. zg691]|uniref:lyase family protein n=1 Tax=Gordonia jinghuaiqii TaxID=2758710 RepID=UPI00166287DF|nr:lyase family protein [Gordonia jinghuaiqii]MBD0863037.1 3-carboxy-cis,cis-muconate cycloisomerase [Gordonia jinghuaiqii]